MNDEARKLRTWVEPKKVQIHTLKQNIELLELQITNIDINIKDGWFIKQQNKSVKEAQNDLNRKIAELNLEQLKSDLEKGFIGKLEKIKLEELQIQLTLEESSLIELNKKILMTERNHKLKDKPGQTKPQDQEDGKTKEVKPGFGR